MLYSSLIYQICRNWLLFYYLFNDCEYWCQLIQIYDFLILYSLDVGISFCQSYRKTNEVFLTLLYGNKYLRLSITFLLGQLRLYNLYLLRTYIITVGFNCHGRARFIHLIWFLEYWSIIGGISTSSLPRTCF